MQKLLSDLKKSNEKPESLNYYKDTEKHLRQGKQPMRKWAKDVKRKLHKGYYWLINMRKDIQPYC